MPAAGAAAPAADEEAGQPREELPNELPEQRPRRGRRFMRPFVVLALPGMYLLYRYNQYRQAQRELSRRRMTERELEQLHHKIDKLLTKLEANEPELPSSQEDECVICVNARATMQTAPCGHQVVCRRCFVKTIQMAVSQRLLPLRCVICRAKIQRLKQTDIPPSDINKHLETNEYVPRSPQGNNFLEYLPGKSWIFPQSASEYNMGARATAGVSGPGNRWRTGASRSSVPASASLYSMASGSSSVSGVSSVSSATSSTTHSTSLSKPTRTTRTTKMQPIGAPIRRSQTHTAIKTRSQSYQDPIQQIPEEEESLRETGERRLPPIKEFQRDYRAGKASTRIRCAHKIATQTDVTSMDVAPTLRSTSTLTASTSACSRTVSRRSATVTKVGQQPHQSASKRELETSEEKMETTRPRVEEKCKQGHKEETKLTKEDKKKPKKDTKARRKEAEEVPLLRD